MQPEGYYNKVWERIESRLETLTPEEEAAITVPDEAEYLRSKLWWCLVGEDLKEKVVK